MSEKSQRICLQQYVEGNVSLAKIVKESYNPVINTSRGMLHFELYRRVSSSLSLYTIGQCNTNLPEIIVLLKGLKGSTCKLWFYVRMTEI